MRRRARFALRRRCSLQFARRSCGPARDDGPSPHGVPVNDVWFVLLTLIVFGLMTLIAKGMERL
jgi:hypothetical protein